MNKAFRVFAEGYFGEYLTCLLETGELPGLGAQDPNSQCATAYRAFTMAKLNPGEGGGTNSGGGNSSGEGGSGSDASAGSSGSSSRITPGKDAESGAGESSYGSSVAHGTPNRFRTYNSTGKNSGVENTAVGNSSADAIKGSQEKGETQRFAVTDTIRNGRKDKKEKVGSTKVKGSEKSEQSNRKNVVLIPINKRLPTAVSDADLGGFGFGDFLRYLIIAAIIIAIIIFVGGQAVQVSKGMD